MDGNLNSRRDFLARLKELDGLDFGPPTSTEWDDKKVLRSPKFRLKALTYDELVSYCQEAVDGLTAGMSERRAAVIMNLAWNLRSEGDPRQRIFPEAMAEEPDTELESLSEDISNETSGSRKVISTPPRSINWEYIRQVCYLCASLLRLFTKEVKSWVRARERLRTSVEFDVNCLEKLSWIFRNRPKFVNTLGEILYALHDLDEGGRATTKVLFEQHLSFAGMHVVDLFSRVAAGLNCPPEKLFRAMLNRGNERELTQLALLRREFMLSGDAGKERKTYRFARLFDSTMFSRLQTKNCRDTVYTLACLCKLIGDSENQDVMSIVALQGLSEDFKLHCSGVAEKVYRSLIGDS